MKLRPFFCLGLILLATLSLSAQSQKEAAGIAAGLSDGSRAVLDRLSGLRELPDGNWKMHAGDLPHAESATLDESGWQPIAVNAKAPNEAVWFRQSYTVPQSLSGYDLTGARIWFQFHAWANGPMPEILYFNGRRVALGDDLEPVVLFDNAKPGETVTVAIKLLHTVDEKHFTGATLKIDFAENRPSPEDLRQEFLSAALLVPALSHNDPARLATLENAIAAVDLKALDQKDQQKFDASLLASRERLAVLRPLLEQVSLHLTGNSHIDAAWLWPWTETVDVVKRTFGTALQLMYEYPQYTYTQSAAAYNEWIAEKYPEMDAEIARRIKEGRWEIVGGMWVEPDLNMPDGESLVRQILVGKRWFKQHYGVDVRIGWNPDSFGYTWQLPQIYKKSGIDYFVTQKMAWNDTNQMPFKFFWWQSPDGSKVLSYFPHDYANDNLNLVRLARDFTIAQKQATGLPGIMDLYGIGDHGGGPTRAILDEGFHWSNGGSAVVTPKIGFGTAQSYFSALEKQIAPESPVWDYRKIAAGYAPPPAVAGKVSIPTWKSGLYFEYHRGVMTTQAKHKKNMREAEVEVLNAEKFSALAWVLGKGGYNYPAAELTEDWKKVLFNQFHDLAAGSGIGQIYKDAQKDYDVVRWSTQEISSHALEGMVARINTQVRVEKSVPVVVFNPVAWDRSGEVAVKFQLPDPTESIRISALCEPESAMNQIDPVVLSRNLQTGEVELQFLAASVPAFGYKAFRIGPAYTPKKGEAQPSCVHGLAVTPQDPAGKTFTLQKNGVRVVISKDSGCLDQIEFVKSGYNLVPQNHCANQLQFFKDTPKDYDAWNIDPGTLDVLPAVIDRADLVELLDAKTEHPSIRITRHWQNSKFVQTISLDGDLVNIDNDIDWHESHVLLKAAFPLAVESDHATYEIPYGTIERPTTRNNSWEKAQFEVPAMRWADLSGKGVDGQIHGLSVINDSKYGYDAVGNTLRITLLRSPKWPDAEADMGHHHFHYALYPHAGTWKEAGTVRKGWEYNYPLTAVVTTAHAGSLPPAHSFASVEPENVVLTAMKKAEDADGLILRVYEWAGKDSTVRFHVPPGASAATVTNLMETPQGSALAIVHEKDGDVVEAPIKPYEILSVRVDYATAAH